MWVVVASQTAVSTAALRIELRLFVAVFFRTELFAFLVNRCERATRN